MLFSSVCRFFALLVWLSFFVPGALCDQSGVADLVIFNGKVWTVDPSRPVAEAVAVRGNRIAFVGSNSGVKEFVGSETEVIDLDGAFVLPGFNDAHTHFENATEWFFEVRLFDVASLDQVVDRLLPVVARVPDGNWITGGVIGALQAWRSGCGGPDSLEFDWCQETIDRVAPNHPVLLQALAGRYYANSLALEYANVNRLTPWPLGGQYQRCETSGELTGVLLGTAGDRVARFMPPKSLEKTLTGAVGVIERLSSLGITSIHDIARVDEISQGKVFRTHVERSFSDLNIFLRLRDRGLLNVRVYPILTLDVFGAIFDRGFLPGSGDDLIRFGALKAFIDGTLMFEPFQNRPDYSGGFSFRFVDEDHIFANIRQADLLGFDPAIHVLGDRAHNMLLDWYESTIGKNPPRQRRFRLVHAEHIKPDDIERAGSMGLIADVTPSHLILALPTLVERFGPQRAKAAFPYRSLIDAGVRLNIVSDLPGSYYKVTSNPISPLVQMYHAVTRMDVDGDPPGGWAPEQRITVQEAIEAYTINPAYASREEAVKGSITPGKLADLVVLSRDLLRIEAPEMLTTRVLLTIFDGRVVYRAAP